MASKDEILESIKSLSVLELSELVKALEEEFGVSAAAPVAMATVQAQMLSGRYRTQLLCSHWSPFSSQCCQLSQACSNNVEDITHILRDCEALSETREKLYDYVKQYSNEKQIIKDMVDKYVELS